MNPKKHNHKTNKRMKSAPRSSILILWQVEETPFITCAIYPRLTAAKYNSRQQSREKNAE